MTDPRRLHETHATELEGFLLDAVRSEAPPPSARARTLAAVALGVAAGGAAAGTAGSAAAAVPAGKTGWFVIAGKWLAIGAGAGAVVAGVAVGPLRGVIERAETPRPVVVAPEPGHAVAAPREPVRAPRVPIPTPAVDAPPAVPPAVYSAGSSPAAGRVSLQERIAEPPAAPAAASGAMNGDGAPAVAMPSTVSALSDEVAFLDAASRALREHDPARAHAALDAYVARFPHGNLGPEATALRAEAFFAQGDVARGERIARTYLAQNPHSPHAARLRALLGDRAGF